jgi:hypothetical protein
MDLPSESIPLIIGQLQATLYAHDVAVDGALPGSRLNPCFTVVSDGLARVGQPELAITLVRVGSTERTFPGSVLNYLTAVHGFARQGRIVDAGGVSGFDPPGPFGLGDFTGLAFAEAPPELGVPTPPGTLTGVFLTHEEVRMATHTSVDRVLHRLGQIHRYFPFPFWCDHRRGCAYPAGATDASLVTKLPKLFDRAATATLSGGTMALRMSAAGAAELADRLAAPEAVAVLVRRDPSVRAALVWLPDQEGPSAISAPDSDGSRVAAPYVAFAPDASEVDEIRFQEDGFTVLLSPPTTVALLAGLRAGTMVEITDAPRLGHLQVSVR